MLGFFYFALRTSITYKTYSIKRQEEALHGCLTPDNDNHKDNDNDNNNANDNDNDLNSSNEKKCTVALLQPFNYHFKRFKHQCRRLHLSFNKL